MGRYYLPLPKLSGSQVSFLSSNLSKRGFTVRTSGRLLHAGAKGSRVTVDPNGLAWSSSELLDAIAPAVPELLSFPKEAVEREGNQNPYFSIKKTQGGLSQIQLFTRMESSRLWSELRKERLIGLTPDERLAICSLLGRLDVTIACLTDYADETSFPVRVGAAQYYRSTIPVSEFLDNLSTTTHSARRNTYVPRDSILRVRSSGKRLGAPSPEELGEWCYLTL